MKSIEKEKICISCEGRIPYHAEVCSYCATDQTSSGMHNSFKAPLFQSQSLEDSLTSLYSPPYQGKRPQFPHPTHSSVHQREEPFFEEETHYYKEVTQKPQMDPLIGATVKEEEPLEKSSLWPTLLLIGGANFAILGLMQLFFSKGGILLLEWNAHYWFLYCLIAVPLLLFGYKKARQLSD